MPSSHVQYSYGSKCIKVWRLINSEQSALAKLTFINDNVPTTKTNHWISMIFVQINSIRNMIWCPVCLIISHIVMQWQNQIWKIIMWPVLQKGGKRQSEIAKDVNVMCRPRCVWFWFCLLPRCLILIYLFDLEFLSLPRCLICIFIVANVFDFEFLLLLMCLILPPGQHRAFQLWLHSCLLTTVFPGTKWQLSVQIILNICASKRLWLNSRPLFELFSQCHFA